MYRPLGATATESGCPPRSISRTTARVRSSTTTSLPDGLVKLVRVFTAASSRCPRCATEVGSPPTARVPPGLGAAGSVMSAKPSRLPGLSV
ncbi:hypothetical protein [Paractinoplanes durhamensis]|uniref:hypothetical protein n=1 Tax=Paractinoplanes durhamensis TaxID=113563 RepID=UPI003634A0E3